MATATVSPAALHETTHLFLLGFIEAEGCFSIDKAPLPKGYYAQGYRCRFTLNQRADDADVLYMCQRETGLGKVYLRKAPTDHSPTAIWVVRRKAEVLALCDILCAAPWQTRKGADFLIWAWAVESWRAVGRSNRWRGATSVWLDMGRLRTLLSWVRHYENAESCSRALRAVAHKTPPLGAAAFWPWLSGFAQGEGCFRVSRARQSSYACSFSILVRGDDAETLRMCQKYSGGLGVVSACNIADGRNPCSHWRVRKKGDLVHLCNGLKGHLYGRKALDFADMARALNAWRAVPRIRGDRQHSTAKPQWAIMAMCGDAIAGRRKWSPSTHDPAEVVSSTMPQLTLFEGV